jgi:plasmid stabilization system protein ParE
MKVVFTDEARNDLDEILQYISANYPAVYRPFETRLRTIITRIGTWPESAQEVEQHPTIRSVPFIRYPYRLFYRVFAERVEVLHIHHSARADLPISTS